MDFPRLSQHRNKWMPFEIIFINGQCKIVSYIEPLDQYLITFNTKTNNAFREILSDKRFNKTKMEKIAEKLSEVMVTLASTPVHESLAQTVEVELKSCSVYIQELRQFQTPVDQEALNDFAEFIGIQQDIVLDYLQMLVFMCASERFIINKDFTRVNKYFMESLKYVVKHEFRNEIIVIFLLIDHALTLICDKQKTFLKQSQYHLSVAEHLLQNATQEDKMSRRYKTCIQFWFYVKVVLAGRLFENYKNTGPKAVSEPLDELSNQVESMQLDDQVVTFDIFPLTNNHEGLLTNDKDLKTLYNQLLEQKGQMQKWEPLRVSYEETSYDIMEKVLKYVKESFSSLKNI